MHNFLFMGTTLMQLLLLHSFFSVLLPASDKSILTISLLYCLAGGILFTSTVCFFPVLVTGMLSVASTFLISNMYRAQLGTKLLFSLLYLAIGFIAESLSFYLTRILNLTNEASNHSEFNNRLLILVFSILVMFFIVFTIKFVKNGNEYKIRKTYYILFTVIIFISLFLMNTLFYYSQKNLHYALSIIGILFINIIIIILFDRMMERFKLADENVQLHMQMMFQDNSYHDITHSFNSIKRIIHDTNKQLLFIETCIRENQLATATEHINITLNKIHSSCERVSTGNLAIDALVSHALNVADDNQIRMEHRINILSEDIQVDCYDLCIILGNVLENAIEATQLVHNAMDRWIKLQISNENNKLFIHVENSCPNISEQSGSYPLKNRNFHGLGLSNVQLAAEKYGGHMKVINTDNQFEVFIFLPVRD